MKHIILIVGLIFASSCAGMYRPLPPDERKVEFIESTQYDSKQAYTRMLKVMSKRFGDSNSAIKLRNESESQIIAQGVYPCEGLRPGGDYMNKYSVAFVLEFQAKDKRVRFHYEDVGLAISYKQHPITTGGQMESAKKCLHDATAELLAAASETPKDW